MFLFWIGEGLDILVVLINDTKNNVDIEIKSEVDLVFIQWIFMIFQEFLDFGLQFFLIAALQ